MYFFMMSHLMCFFPQEGSRVRDLSKLPCLPNRNEHGFEDEVSSVSGGGDCYMLHFPTCAKCLRAAVDAG